MPVKAKQRQKLGGTNWLINKLLGKFSRKVFIKVSDYPRKKSSG